MTDEREFRERSESIFRAVIQRLDLEDPDEIEGDLSAGVVRIRSAAGTTFILNVQPPLREIWYAAGDRAWHFQRQAEAGTWIDPRNGDELAGVLGSTISRVVGREIAFDLPR